MKTIIEKIFEQKCSDSSFQILKASWEMIKLQIPKTLSCISQIFPHYTLHNEEHSIAILESTERFLGKANIEKLSVTDLWLIMCSAYFHDIGMYVDGNEITEIFKKSSFIDFVKNNKKDKLSDLHKYASNFSEKDGKLYFLPKELDLQSYNSARYLLSAYIRDEHAKRSKRYIQKKTNMYQIDRLYEIISNICLMHYEDFDCVLEMPYSENGICGDICHPRFVACALRLADYLDLDASRISPPLLDHISSSIPAESTKHIQKSLSISHLSITPNKIEITGTCDDLNTAITLDSIFSGIKNELNNQRNSWREIAPQEFDNHFPMTGKMEIQLNGYETIDNRYKIQFQVDSKRVVDLLQGSNLYDNKNRCIRELLQNAVDATYLRIFLENETDLKKLDNEEGFLKFSALCSLDKYKIKISLQKKDRYYHISIEDSGIGMNKTDFQYLLKIGSGKFNPEKKKIIDRMPEYCKPFGCFGIGFQSIFLITDKATFETRKLDEAEPFIVEIPTPINHGILTFKKGKKHFQKYGTKIDFYLNKLEDVNFPIVSDDKLHIHSSQHYDDIIGSYDFIKNNFSDIEISKIYDEIALFAKESNIKIELNGEIVENPKKTGKGLLYEKGSNLFWLDNIQHKSNMYPMIPFGWRVFYRNQFVEKTPIIDQIRFIRLSLNILSSNADEILSLNRNELKKEYETGIRTDVINATIEYIKKHFDSATDVDKKVMALFVEFYGNNEQKNSISELRRHWLNFPLFLGCKHEILESIQKREKEIILQNSYHSAQSCKMDGENISIICNFAEDYINFLVHILIQSGYGFYLSTQRENLYEFKFLTNGTKNINWRSWFILYKKNGVRSLMPCIGYEKLQVKEQTSLLSGRDPMWVFEKINYPQTACPYIAKYSGVTQIEWDASDDFYKWVFQNRANQKVSLEEIKKMFKKLKSELDPIVKQINKEEISL